jgi:hypothetical protein
MQALKKEFHTDLQSHRGCLILQRVPELEEGLVLTDPTGRHYPAIRQGGKAVCRQTLGHQEGNITAV